MWRGADLRLSERPVAIKRALSGGDAVAAAKVRREAEVLASVNHPNVVTVYDAVEEDGDWWIVMEFVNGRSLAQTGTVAAEEAARYGAQLAGGLEAVHAKGILHRDIKPANVMVTDQGHAKLADFGIARQVHAEPTLTGTGAVTGTPGYVAPEVVKGAKFTQAADVFSLGATLFHLVEGTSPFGEGNAHSLLWRTAQGDRVEPKRAGVLAPVLDQLLQTDPKRRIKVHEARVALAKLSGEPTSGVRRKVGRRQWIWEGAAAVALAMLAAATWTGLRTIGSDGLEDLSPAEETSDSRSDGGAQDFVGDEASADPCALLDVEALSVYGETRRDSDRGGFNRCGVLVGSGAGEVQVEASLHASTGAPASADAESVGSIDVIRHEGDHEACWRALVLPGGKHTISVGAVQDPSGEADLCMVADTAVEGALAAMAAGQIPRRDVKLDFEAESLYFVDACGLLDAEALELFPGIDTARPVAEYAGWGCWWSNTTNGNQVMLYFDRDDPPGTDESQQIEVSGHAAFVEGDRWGAEACLVNVVHDEYADRDPYGDTVAEYVGVLVYGEYGEPMDELCDLAAALAEPVAAALPHA